MFKSKWTLFYGVILFADLILIAFHAGIFRYATKPLLMIILAIYFLGSKAPMPRLSKILLVAALFFSFGGDVLLLLPDKYFLPGLGSFLLAHILYMLFFLKIRYSNFPIPLCKYPLVFLHAAVLIVFILFLLPYLGSLTVPVIVYALAVSLVVQCVLHAFRFREQPAGWYCMIGSVLFLISDGIIAVEKFYHPLPQGGLLVMFTYGLAQLGLVYGSIQYYRDIAAGYDWQPSRSSQMLY
ncbi:lysoplasmalogenase [Chitinophaga nivalis]|uniref:Lysoplasmalogenase n=1 Tax=Chitinophaga nivalis TaxID=2991709 RepID=A0ABT3IWM6_9BACT|nr:lysoplasmalogenase [Chitinophaga nivalis]MCW3462199.1 lysoplasmalogenase [Chitinophaga nivalis]MCW3488109.1 lysoplasmalogenase [Chitinophaga nivalis]